jgi:hypothetical protein
VRRALARDREQRYPSMAALREDLLHPRGSRHGVRERPCLCSPAAGRSP